MNPLEVLLKAELIEAAVNRCGTAERERTVSAAETTVRVLRSAVSKNYSAGLLRITVQKRIDAHTSVWWSMGEHARIEIKNGGGLHRYVVDVLRMEPTSEEPVFTPLIAQEEIQ